MDSGQWTGTGSRAGTGTNVLVVCTCTGHVDVHGHGYGYTDKCKGVTLPPRNQLLFVVTSNNDFVTF